MRECCRDFSIFQQWLGFNTTYLDLEGDERASGRSSYSFIRKLKLALEVITSQSNRLLYVSIIFGLLFVIISIIIVVYNVIKYYTFDNISEGWTSLLVSIYFVGGIIMMFLGIIGLYIGRIFDETKNRPLYVVKEVLNSEESNP